MKVSLFNTLLTGIFILTLTSCEVVESLVPSTRSASEVLEYGAGLSYPQSFRNHHYTFTLKADNATLDIAMESTDTELAFWLFNPLGQQINRNWGQRTLGTKLENLSAGDYHLIIGTAQRGESGSYDLSVVGNISELKRVNSQDLTAAAAWDTNGGGLSNPQSYRNHHYTVEVTENNSAIDLILESNDTDVALWVYNLLGEQQARTWGSRSNYLVEAANAGTYTIIAGSNNRDVLDADYDLYVNGQIKNLQRIASQDIFVEGNITNGGGLSTPNSPQNAVYTFEVSDNNTSVDIIVESSDFNPAFWLYNPLGERIDRRWGGRRIYSVSEVSKGTYTLICGTTNIGESGKYNVSVVGEFKDFK